MSTVTQASPERISEISDSLAAVRARIEASAVQHRSTPPVLVAVSKFKPESDILACYESGQRDFGENYVQELVHKASQLPDDIRWHFIGTLQSNKAKTLASVSNLHTVQTVTSTKLATALDKTLEPTRTAPLNVLLQVNTSGETSKSGLPPLSPESDNLDASEIVQLSKHIIKACPRLRLQGLMTIGSLSESLQSETQENHDFRRLKETRDVLQRVLEHDEGVWGDNGRLLLSMGMSSDFEPAIRAGSDIVRVGTGIFGTRIIT